MLRKLTIESRLDAELRNTNIGPTQDPSDYCILPAHFRQRPLLQVVRIASVDYISRLGLLLLLSNFPITFRHTGFLHFEHTLHLPSLLLLACPSSFTTCTQGLPLICSYRLPFSGTFITSNFLPTHSTPQRFT